MAALTLDKLPGPCWPEILPMKVTSNVEIPSFALAHNYKIENLSILNKEINYIRRLFLEMYHIKRKKSDVEKLSNLGIHGYTYLLFVQ